MVNAHKIETTIAEDGTLTLKGLPFQAGEAVEVIVLQRPLSKSLPPDETANSHPLQGQQPYRYDAPFEPAVPLEDSVMPPLYCGSGAENFWTA